MSDNNTVTLGDLSAQGLDELDLPTNSGMLPVLRLQQPRGRNVTRPGEFQDMRTLESYPTLENVIFLRMRTQRLYYAEGGFDGESSLQCSSDDGKTPSPDIKVKLSANCKECPKAQWTGSRQECREAIATIIALGAERHVYLLSFGPSSVRTAKALGEYVVRNGLPALFTTVVDLHANQQTAKNGNPYFTIAFANPRVLPDAEVAKIKALFDQYRQYPLKAQRQHGD